MKRICTLVFALFLTFLALPPARYSVQAETSVSASNLPGADTPAAASILIEAHQLLNEYGIRPLWPNLPYSKGQNVPVSQAPDVVAHLITCESQGISVKHLDSNDRYSYGVLQIQSSTWAEFEASSGIEGNPMDSLTAVQMGLWAVEHGQLYQWSCAGILHIESQFTL